MKGITLADIEAAVERLEGHAVKTPLIESAALNERAGLRVLIKPETLQRTASFKFRGAFNRLVQLTSQERKRGVVAFSSGNHAQGVALAARLLGIAATIVMPHDAPKVKVDATRGYGAEVRFYDRRTESREKIAASLAADSGGTVVPSFDDRHIIAGQGTVGFELARQAEFLDLALNLVVAPIGGGGLISGIATALKAISPNTAIVGVEPVGFDDTCKSLQHGERVRTTVSEVSLCDALLAPTPGELTFPIMQRSVSGVAVVSDSEVIDAMRYAFAALKLVVEPSGAAPLAALLAGRLKSYVGGCIALVLSGGNIDAELFARIISS